MVKLLSNGIEVPFSTTIFPDGTSQVWKLDSNKLFQDGNNKILWLFENEGELMHVCQLAQLLTRHYECSPDLHVPYLPYGRQDKLISNETSFSLFTFESMLRTSGIHRINTFDAHSDAAASVKSTPAVDFHKSLPQHDLICFPDKGAAQRYKESYYGSKVIFCEKVRDQLTGNITGLKLITMGHDLTNQSVLIVDDICDGGMTFIKVAEALNPFKPKQVNLAVSHGLFSKGKQCLHEAGITNIYTTNSLLRNPEGFKVW